MSTRQIMASTKRPTGIPRGWKKEWLPRGTNADFQRALDVFGELIESPENPYCLGIEGVKSEILFLAYSHNAELDIVDVFPLSSKTRDQLKNLQKAISLLVVAIDSMHKYGWEKMNQVQWPEGTVWGWEDIAKESVKLLKALEPQLTPAIESVSAECRKGGWKYVDRHGSPNLHLAQRARALLYCCGVAHGKTATRVGRNGQITGGHVERLSAAIKTYATNQKVLDTALRNDVTEACNQSDIEFKYMIAQCHHRNARRKFGDTSRQALAIEANLTQLNFEINGLA